MTAKRSSPKRPFWQSPTYLLALAALLQALAQVIHAIRVP
jgi:hypothetical protein